MSAVQIASDMNELKSINVEIKRLSEQIKRLKERKKDLDENIIEYLKLSQQHFHFIHVIY